MRTVAIAVGILSMLGLAGVGQAGEQTSARSMDSSIFETLHQLEQRETFHRSEHRRLETLVKKRATPGMASTATAAERASERVAQRVVGRLGRWAMVTRASRAHILESGPGVGERLRRVLRQVETRDLQRLSDSIDTWKRLRERARQPNAAARSQARLRVQLAQHSGAADAAESSRRDAGSQAAGAEETKEAIRAAQNRLSKTMEDLVTYRTGEDFHRRKGALLPPVDDAPVVGYGKRQRDGALTYVRHTGLSYDVEMGHPVRAVADGRVVHAERFEGFGRLVIVAHGDAYHSLYAHLSDYAVDVGDDVGRGDRVGDSGESGSLRGPTLYFELRRGGVPLNPEPWFVRLAEEPDAPPSD